MPFAALKALRPRSELLYLDRDGWFWLADREGLYRQKGDAVKTYDVKIKDAPNGFFFNVYRDRSGGIRFGSAENDLFRLNL